MFQSPSHPSYYLSAVQKWLAFVSMHGRKIKAETGRTRSEAIYMEAILGAQ